MPQIIGSGAALFDFDGDGRLDIYLLHNGGPQRRRPTSSSTSKPDGTLQGRQRRLAAWTSPATAWAWPSATSTTTACPTCSSPQYGGVAPVPQQRRRHASRDVTEEAGLDNPAWGTSAAFFDYDRDGWLDLVVVNYVDYDPTVACARPRRPARLLRPQRLPGHASPGCSTTAAAPAAGGASRFEDVTLASGLGRVAGPGPGRASAPTSTATAGPTSSSPTTASPTTCGSTSTTAPSRRRRVRAAWPTTAWARRRPAWASRWATWTATACSTCSSPT